MDNLKTIRMCIDLLQDVKVKKNPDANASIRTAIDILIGAQGAIEEQLPPRPMATRKRRIKRKEVAPSLFD